MITDPFVAASIATTCAPLDPGPSASAMPGHEVQFLTYRDAVMNGLSPMVTPKIPHTFLHRPIRGSSSVHSALENVPERYRSVR